MSIYSNLPFFLGVFLVTLVLSVVLTLIIKKMAIKYNILDIPDEKRRFHGRSVPKLGGTAIFLAFFVVLFFVKDNILIGDLELHHWLGVFIGSLVLIIGGILDDKYNLSARKQIIFPLIAVLCVVAGGVGIDKITNPFGGLLFLDQIKIPVLAWAGEMHYFVLIADLFTIFWLIGMMYTTKLLDGLDGLVTSVVGIGSIIVFLFTMTTSYFQPDVGLAALILAGACFGFLILTWYPAKIFLGEGGSLFLGFILGVLSIISGGKIAIALLIMGVPILDLIWTIIRRLLKKQHPFKTSDRGHLHFRMLDVGLSIRKTVVLYSLFVVIFGTSTLFLQSRGKAIGLVILVIIMASIILFLRVLDKKKKIT